MFWESVREIACPEGEPRTRRRSRLALTCPSTCIPTRAPPANMSGFDADRVFSVSVHDVPEPAGPDSPSQTEKLLLEFLLQYRVGGDFIYRCACNESP